MDNDYTFGTLDEAQLSQQIQACKRLWAAKMATHIQDYANGVKMTSSKKYKNQEKVANVLRDARVAFNWIFDESEDTASFKWCCALFKIDYQKARNKITHQWRSNLGLDKNVFNY